MERCTSGRPRTERGDCIHLANPAQVRQPSSAAGASKERAHDLQRPTLAMQPRSATCCIVQIGTLLRDQGDLAAPDSPAFPLFPPLTTAGMIEEEAASGGPGVSWPK